MRASIFLVIGSVLAHGNLLKPEHREPGPALAAACGQGMLDDERDPGRGVTGSVQLSLERAAKTPGFDSSKCNLWQCKGELVFSTGSLYQDSRQAINLRIRKGIMSGLRDR